MNAAEAVSDLARDECLALAANPAAAALGRREPEAIAAAAAWLSGLSPAEAQVATDQLATWANPAHPRLHPVHDDWVAEAAAAVPERDRARYAEWLRVGGPVEVAGRRAALLHQRALRAFGVGPTHLVDVPEEGDHLGWACMLGDIALNAFLEDLSRRTLAIAIATHDARRLLAALASLDDRHRGAVRAYVSDYQSIPSEMRARTQECFLDVTRSLGNAGRTRLIPTLGLHMVAMASGGRFDLEARYLAQRLPKVLAARLDRALASSARRPTTLAGHARALVASSLETVRSQTSEAP